MDAFTATGATLHRPHLLVADGGQQRRQHRRGVGAVTGHTPLQGGRKLADPLQILGLLADRLVHVGQIRRHRGEPDLFGGVQVRLAAALLADAAEESLGLRVQGGAFVFEPL
jgi:hypothetical protein